jgi:subtilase family serine protease
MPKNQAVIFLSFALLLTLPAMAQPSRIAGRIDNNQRVTLTGHISPKTLGGIDRGAVDPALQIPRVTLMLQPSASQQANLDQLLAQQQDPTSPNYHRSLTPEQFADRFGVSQADLNQIIAWLKSQNLKVVGVARARNWIAVSGAAGAVGQAFGVQIHHYLVNTELHFANTVEPSIPVSLQGVVTAIRGLNDFRLRPALRRRGSVTLMQPQYNNATFCQSTIAPSGHCIGPNDLATIYNITPLFNAGLNGSGQTSVVVGQTDIRVADITAFRSFFSLPAINLQQTLVPGSADPGISPGDLGESDLDLENSGAVARNATINFVYSTDVMTSAQYAIDQNLAPILSMSYGDCEAA